MKDPREYITGDTIVIGVIVFFSLIVVGGIIAFLPKGGDPEEVNNVLEGKTSDRPFKGDKDSDIELVEFSDFQCPACAMAQIDLFAVSKDYQEDIKLVYMHYPLNQIHDNANYAALASETVFQNEGNELFWEFHDELFEKQGVWQGLDESSLTKIFMQYAENIGVEDLETFEEELTSGKYQEIIDSDIEVAEEIGVSSTPSIYLNGEKLDNYSYDTVSKKIEDLL